MDSLITSSGLKIDLLIGTLSIRHFSRIIALLPRLNLSCLIVVRAGLKLRQSGRSSYPIILMSSGTFNPLFVTSEIAPDAIKSLAHMIAVAP